MREATKRRVRLFMRLLFLGTLTGVVYQISLALVFFSGSIVPRILVGVIGGASMTAPIAAMELFLLRSSRWGRHLKEARSEEHTSELQSRGHLVCRLLLEKKKKKKERIQYPITQHY